MQPIRIRLPALRHAGRILAFDRGRVGAQGTHAELLAADGVYARLVRIQTQVTKQPTVDTLLAETDQPAQDTPEPVSPAGLVWLDPARHRFRIGDQQRIELHATEGGMPAVVFVIRTFPATHPDEYLSVRGWDEHGDEVELGMIRRLDDWPEEERRVLRHALRRRSLIREVLRVHEVRLVHGYLDFDVEADCGRRRFTIRWTQGQAFDFGIGGKLLVDTDENRWVVPRIDALPQPDRERFLQYVYW